MIRPLKQSLIQSLKASAKQLRNSNVVEDTEGIDYEPNQWCLRAILYNCISCLFTDVNSSMLIAFFPKALESRYGYNQLKVGILFSIFHASNMITTLIVPRMHKKFGGISILAHANFLQATTTISMAICQVYIRDPHVFFYSCCAIRTLQGIMTSLIESSASSLSLRSVPRNWFGGVITWLNSFRVIGFVCGPIIGGTLYNLFGFPAPFILSSSLHLGLAVSMRFYPIDERVDNKIEHPNEDTASETTESDNEGGFDRNNNEENGSSEPSVSKLFQSIITLAVFLTVIIVSSAATFLEPMFQPLMSNAPYRLNSMESGAVYIISTLFFATVSLRGGQMIRPYIGDYFALVGGIIFVGVGYLVVAPAPSLTSFTFEGIPLSVLSFLHQSTRSGGLALTQTCLTLIGIGSALLWIPSNMMLIKEGERLGLDMIEHSKSVGTFLNLAINIGASIGPILSGALLMIFTKQEENEQNPSNYLIYSKTCTILGIFMLAFTCFIMIITACVYVTRRITRGITEIIRSRLHHNPTPFNLTSTPSRLPTVLEEEEEDMSTEFSTPLLDSDYSDKINIV